MIYDILKEVETLTSVLICLYYTFELNTSIHSIFILKAPMTAHVPLLRKIAWPVFQECSSCLYMNYKGG